MNENDLKPFLELEKKILGELKVSLVGIIVSYDEVAKTANIQPVVKENFTNGKVDKLPILTNIYCVGQIPEVGDLALVVFTDRNSYATIKEYSYTPGTPIDNLLRQVPKEIRHNLSNGIAICGFINPQVQFTIDELKFLKKNYNIIRKVILENGGVDIEN